MKLAVSVRIAEAPAKDRMTMPFEGFARLARDVGFACICMRASAVGVQTPPDEIRRARRLLDERNLSVSMATTDFDVPLNNDRGPDNLRDFAPHLDVAVALGTDLIRICMKTEDDIRAARTAADQARRRGIRIAHQCHTDSLFETVDDILEVTARVGRENFGLIYEPANLMLCGQPYGAEVLERFSPHLMNVYLQNHRLADDGPCRLPTRVRGEVRYHDIPLWQSEGVDFQAVFAGLERIGYNGTVTVHQAFASLMGPQEAARKSYDFLTSLAQFDVST